MYLRERLIKALNIKNIIFTIVGVFLLVFSVSDMTRLLTKYWGDWFTIWHAKATPEDIRFFCLAIVILPYAIFSRYSIGNANYYSSYFEGDLDGIVSYDDIALVTGKTKRRVKSQLHFLKIFYMKNFQFGDKEHIVLDSKLAKCECKNCGATIEKRMYFTGRCPYCESSNLFAKVIAGERFYSVEKPTAVVEKNSGYYQSRSFKTSMFIYLFLLLITLTCTMVSLIAIFDNALAYHNQDYLRELLLSGKGSGSYELIKWEIFLLILGFVGIFVFCSIFSIIMIKKLSAIFVAEKCSKAFTKARTPYINLEELGGLTVGTNQTIAVKRIIGSIRRRYLINCNFEVFEGKLKLILSRKIVKDQCPFCGGAITGKFDENYKCEYCGNRIMDVTCKKQRKSNK